MRGQLTARAGIAATIGLAVALTAASPALAAAPSAPIAGIGDLLGDLADTVLGGVNWSVNVAGDFILNLLGGLIKDLIPRSWITKGVQIIGWLVAAPDYTVRVGSPDGGRSYGFAGVNAMRELYTWLGMAIAPLTLVYATSRCWSGQGDPPHVPLTRALIVGMALLNYSWLWSQAVALTNQITQAILGVPAVTTGVQRMFEVLIAGAALGGLPLVGLLLMGVGGLALLALIFVKVTLILIGALVFAIGPLMIGLVATDRGNAFARAWLTIALGLCVLPILWASVFAIAAVLINDASGGASVIGGASGLSQILGGLLIAMAAIAGFWLNIKLTKGFAAIAGGQLAGLLALAGGGARSLLGGGAASGSGGGTGGAVAAAGSLRGFGAKVAGATSGATSALVPAGRGAAVLAGAGTLARGGLIGAGGAVAAKGMAGAAASRTGQAVASSRAGSLATRAARGARSGWSAAVPAATRTPSQTPQPSPPPTASAPTRPAHPTATAPSSTSTGTTSAPAAGAQTSAGERGATAAARPRGIEPAPRGAMAATPPASADPHPTGEQAARDAFGRSRPAKPTRSLRHPFRRPR